MEWRFNPAPGWPAPPPGWSPPEGWQPEPDWPPAPEGWEFWVDDIAGISTGVARESDDPAPRVLEGDGIRTALYEFRASRLMGGRWFSPNFFRVWPDRVEEHEPHAVRRTTAKTIHFSQVAQIAIQRGSIGWSHIIVESSGGHVIRIVGVPNDKAAMVKAQIDARVRNAGHRGPEGAVHVSMPAQSPAIDLADQLGRLAALRDSGVLTEEEFAGQKARLLSSHG